jgi:hypothetical protein
MDASDLRAGKNGSVESINGTTPNEQPEENGHENSCTSSKDSLMQYNVDKDVVGRFGWIARGDREPTEIRVPFNKPKLRQVRQIVY